MIPTGRIKKLRRHLVAQVNTCWVISQEAAIEELTWGMPPARLDVLFTSRWISQLHLNLKCKPVPTA